MTTAKFRDQFLDIAKGLAIILVVVGHVLQGSAERFDDLFWFRVIYSFHMPMFVFLSGAVAAIVFVPGKIQDGIGAAIHQAKLRISKATIRLLLPFVAWCIINQLIFQQSESVWTALILAFRRPDTALWFLLAIFYCITLFSLATVLFAGIFQLLKKMNSESLKDLVADGRVQIALLIFLWWGLREHTPRGAGLSLLRPYFIYYLLGIGFYKYLFPKMEIWKYLLMGAIFIALIPFWDRVAPNNFSNNQIITLIPEQVIYFYAGIVAICGTFLMLSVAKRISTSKPGPIKKFLVLCGQLSLGIYALHYFFLPFSPKVFAPLVISVVIAYAINKTPILRTVLLGER